MCVHAAAIPSWARVVGSGKMEDVCHVGILAYYQEMTLWDSQWCCNDATWLQILSCPIPVVKGASITN